MSTVDELISMSDVDRKASILQTYMADLNNAYIIARHEILKTITVAEARQHHIAATIVDPSINGGRGRPTAADALHCMADAQRDIAYATKELEALDSAYKLLLNVQHSASDESQTQKGSN